MKRRIFFKTAAIGSAAALVGFPLLKAESAPTSNLAKNISFSDINWYNNEPSSPYVDSNLWIRQDGADILNEPFTGNGTITMNTNNAWIEVIQMGIVGRQWPTDGHGTLFVSQHSKADGSTTTLYDNRTSTWVNGIIDSFGFSVDGNYDYHVECYTWYMNEP